MFFSIFALILTKALPKRVFLTILSYPTQSFTKKGVYSIFDLTLTKALPKRVFSLFLPLFFPKPYQKGVFYIIARKYAHSSFSSLVQSLLPKDTLLRTYFTIFALVLTKALPKRCFLNFCPYSIQSHTKNCVRLYLFPFSNQRPSKKCV